MAKEAQVDELEPDAVLVADDQDEEGATELTEVEKIAAELGWKPEAQWKGDKTNWTDAAQFLRQTAAKADAAKKELKDVRKDVDAQVSKRVEALEKTIRATRDRELKQVTTQYNEAIRNAIADKDLALEADLRRELAQVTGEYEDLNKVELTPEELKRAEDEFVENFPVSYPKLQKPFWEKHAWLLDDEAEIEDFAMVEAEITRQMQNGKSLAEALDAAETIISKAFPDRYDDDEPEPKPRARREEPRVPVLASGKRGATRTLASRLPPEARKQAEKEIKAGLFGSYEEFAEVYQEAGGQLL
jgi:hypothetical protein